MTRSAISHRDPEPPVGRPAARPLAARPRAGAEMAARRPDYRSWSIEELRALAHQLQLPGAAGKTRSELLRLFDSAA